ncbi:hypothetical protein BDM02DRAFT_3108526 [Thelephora ganbajun]|uniref:Uncharacterized protein n=1 Tax=Thelephora ganbajun TaxID=370292 RepID=A0ACB6ZU31_THEGA|nr:hypothetical protein BDM02DRAFT_3108526 [Thelephora ganbajun]
MATPTTASTSTQPVPPSKPLVATGDWTKNLVHLAKTAELKKHALTLQLHTAHILSAHESLEQKNKAIQDLREQKNKLESERNKLLNALREVNEDRDKADIMEATLTRECSDLRLKIQTITDGEYAIAKRDVDQLRAELGQPPLPNLQETLEERKREFMHQQITNNSGSNNNNNNPAVAKLNTNKRPHSAINGTTPAGPTSVTESTTATGEPETAPPPQPGKRPRGRPKGSKTKKKNTDAPPKEGEPIMH